jgi:hypothetical protein
MAKEIGRLSNLIKAKDNTIEELDKALKNRQLIG